MQGDFVDRKNSIEKKKLHALTLFPYGAPRLIEAKKLPFSQQVDTYCASGL